MNTPFLFRENLTAGKLASLFIAGLLLQNALLVLWIEYNVPLFFRVWGFSIVPAYLVPIVFLFLLYRINWEVIGNVKRLFGPIRFWFIGLGIPLIAFCGMGLVAMELLNPKIGWRWTTYALSGVFDLPLNFVFLLPLLLVQTGLWIAAPILWIQRRHAILIAGGAIVLSQVGLFIDLVFAGDYTTPATAAILLFSVGVFLASLLRRGGILVASFSLLLSATAVTLLFGLEVEVLTNILIGYDVVTVEGLIPQKHHFFYVIPIGAFFLVTALLAPSGKGNR